MATLFEPRRSSVQFISEWEEVDLSSYQSFTNTLFDLSVNACENLHGHFMAPGGR